jgi:hypothetical protein
MNLHHVLNLYLSCVFWGVGGEEKTMETCLHPSNNVNLPKNIHKTSIMDEMWTFIDELHRWLLN